MATDATGTPTSPDSIPTYATSADAPSGKGFNAAMAVIQTALSARWLKSLFTTTGDIAYASGVSTPARLGIGSTGNVLTVAGGLPTWAAPVASSVTYRKSTAKAVNTTVAATDLLNAEITVASGVMGTTGVLRGKAWGNQVQNSGGVANAPRFQLVLGGVTLIDTGVGATLQNLATRYGWEVNFSIINLGAANSQDVSFNAMIGGAISANAAVALTTGNGLTASYISANAGHVFSNGENTSAVNTAVSQALVLNVINGSASALCETKLTGALIEVI